MFRIRCEETDSWCHDPDFEPDIDKYMTMPIEELEDDPDLYYDVATGNYYFTNQPVLEFESALDAKNYLDTSDFFIGNDYTVVEV